MYDEVRGRIYTFGGLTDTLGIKTVYLQEDSDEDND